MHVKCFFPDKITPQICFENIVLLEIFKNANRNSRGSTDVKDGETWGISLSTYCYSSSLQFASGLYQLAHCTNW